MERFNKQETNTPIETTEEGREASIKTAEINLVKIFETKLAEVLERIGENPYFKGLESNY